MSAKAAPEAKIGQTPEAKTARSFSAAPKPLLLRKCACGPSAGGGGCEECSKPLPLQRRAASHDSVSSTPPIVNDVLSSPGRPLDAPTRGFMESRFGHDFGQVRIHDDAQAAESARTVNAHAYTVGQDVVFASGKYDPDSFAGRHLLAHELAHTVQQKGLQFSSDGVGLDRGAEYQQLEREADAAAAAVVQGGAVELSQPASRPTLSRADEGTVAPAKLKKPKQKPSSFGAHTITPTEVFTSGQGAIEEFTVEPFYLPGEKGPNALPIYEAMAGKGLETVLEIQGSGKTRTALWQRREVTETLKDLWLQKVGWTRAAADDLWERSGGDKTFPQVGGKTCQMDHIVELQIGGNNPPENIQPLDAGPNQSSGGAIKGQLETLAKAIANDAELSSGTATQLKLRFVSVRQHGAPKKAASACPVKGNTRTCLEVEACAKQLKVEKTASGGVEIARADYPITAGGRPPTNLKTPVTFANRANEEVAIESDSQNSGASMLIPGLLLTALRHQKGKTVKPDIVAARIDDRDKTRLPISLDPGTKPLDLHAAADGNLTLDPKDKKGGIGFTYKYLSPGRITEIGLDEAGGTFWKGTLTPAVPFIGPLGVEYAKEKLLVTKGLDEETLKKRSVLGMRITKAQVQLHLAPEFKPVGVIEMQMGAADAPIAKASLSLETDGIGLVAKGKLKVNIPKMETAETDITYKGGGGRNEWNAQIQIKSENIKLGSSVSVTGGFNGLIDKGGIQFTGKINATFPGSPPNTAELGIQKGKTGWLLFGGGTFNFPKIDPVTVKVTYDLEKDRLVATGKTGFQIPSIGLGGRLDEVTFVITKDEPVKVSGKGGLDYKSKNGKAEGHVDVTLHPTGKFSGKGSLTYKIKENLIVTGIVELDNNQKLRVTGELLVTRYELFKKYEKKKELIDPPLNIPIPIPGLSIGTSGVVFLIQGGVGVSISFGPGTLEPLKLTAGFDPLEDDPDFKATVNATVKVPAEATLSAWVSGSLAIQVDIGIGSAGVDGGLKLQGDLTLRAGAFANLDAAYEKKRLTAKLVAGIETKLLLGLTLSAFARAWAGAFGIRGELRKDWILARKVIDTGIGFSLSAPFEYADDTGVKLPEMKDITLKKPEFDFKRILGQVFGDAPEKKTES